MRLSTAMRKSPLPDPFEAAHDGALSLSSYSARIDYNQQRSRMSDESLAEVRVRSLHYWFPHLGLTVRSLPRALWQQLEHDKVLPRVRRFQLRYRQSIHMSLWGVIATLYDRHNRSKEDISGLLAGGGL